MTRRDGKSFASTNLRMDDLEDTVYQYGKQLQLFKLKLHQVREKKNSLQERLQKERKLTSQAKAQLENLRGIKNGLEEREKCQQQGVQELHAKVHKGQDILSQKLQKKAELRQRIENKIKDLEASSKDILSSFQSLKLKDYGDQSQDGEEEEEVQITEDISCLESNIAALEEEKANIQRSRDPLPLDVLKQIGTDLESFAVSLEQEYKSLTNEVYKLEKDLEKLNTHRASLAKEGF